MAKNIIILDIITISIEEINTVLVTICLSRLVNQWQSQFTRSLHIVKATKMIIILIMHTNIPRKAIIRAICNGISPKITFQITGRVKMIPPALLKIFIGICWCEFYSVKPTVIIKIPVFFAWHIPCDIGWKGI